MTEHEWIGLDDVPPIPDMSWVDAQEQHVNGDEPTEDTWAPRNLADLPDKPPIQPTLGNAGITYPGKRHVFSGPQESAKTLAAYAIALQIIRDQGTVVVIDFEMGAWEARNRMRELGYTNEDLASLLYIEPDQSATPQRIQRLVNLNPRLVIIDAAAGAYDNQGLDDNKRQDVEKFTSLYVKDFWKAEIATIVLDHVVKNAETRGNYAIGSERKVGGADVHLGFTVLKPIQRGGDGIYKITTHKDRGGFLKRGRLADLHVTSDPDTHALTCEFKEPAEAGADGWRPTGLMEAVSRHIEITPANRTSIYNDVHGKRDYLVVAVDRLLAEKYAAETVPGSKGTIITSIRPYREENEEPSPSSPSSPGDTRSPGTSPPSRRGTETDTVPYHDDDSDIPF